MHRVDKIKRFPQEYARYRLSKQQVQDGTPLEQFAFLSLAEVDALKCRGIYTVEALAAMPLEKSAALGVDKERDLALRFMEQAKGNSALAAWQQTEEKYLSRIKQLEAEVNSLRAIVRKGKR